MIISTLRKRLNDTSISKKLYFTIGFTTLLVMIELCTLWLSITTLSSVRSYVGGEGLWSKAQKDAILNLRDYAYLRRGEDYNDFHEFLKVPFGDKAARIELEKAIPDYVKVRQGLLQGRNHPDDIDGMMMLLRRFHRVYYLKKAFTAWAKAEPVLEKIIANGEQIHLLVKAKASNEKMVPLLLQLEELNVELTQLEDEFSLTLGEGARWLENLVLRIVLTLSLTIGVASILIAISINRSLKKGVDAIIHSASAIKKGALKTRVPVYSKDEIGLLAVSFNEMTEALDANIVELKLTEQNMIQEKERAEKSEMAKQDFLVNMSHEMRTPMNAILGFAKQLEEELSDADQLESIKMIVLSGNHLLVTLNDILDFSKIGVGDIAFVSERFDIAETVQSVCKLVEPSANQKKLTIRYKISNLIPAIVYGDAARLTQILMSLITNAVKFTEEGSILISALMLKENESDIVVEFGVKDTGIGIALAQQEKIFGVFEQATNNMTRKFGGIGIGLSIVKNLVVLQKGEISLNSSPGKGSEFYFKLPFKKNKDGKAVPLTKVADSFTRSSKWGSRIKILVVEDNYINQILVFKLLQKHNYEIVSAENGKIALEKLANEEFDLILMDLQMPELDGYETTKRIRNLNSSKKNIPIIAMTAHTTKGDREECLAIGMNEYIAKPYESIELYDKIHGVLAKSVHL